MDHYALLAAKYYGISNDDVTKDQRQYVKNQFILYLYGGKVDDFDKLTSAFVYLQDALYGFHKYYD